MNPTNPLDDLRWQIKYLADPTSSRYGHLLKWHHCGEWQFGIGLSDSHIFDIGARFRPVLQEDALFVERNATEPLTLLQEIARHLQSLGLLFRNPLLTVMEQNCGCAPRAIATAPLGSPLP